MELTSKQKRVCTFLLISIVAYYTLSMAIKLSYSAVLVNVIDEFNVTKAEASIGLTLYYFLYATAQIFLAPFMRKLNLKVFLLITSILSSISFSILCFSENITTFNVIMLLNGLLQSGIYMTSFFFLGKYLPREMDNKVSIFMSMGFAIGTALAYGVGAFFTAIDAWKLIFIFFAIVFLVSLFVMLVALKQAENNLTPNEEKTEKKTETKQFDKGTFILFIYIAIIEFFVMGGYYLLNNWLPSLLYDIYGIDKSYSLLITILMPVFLTFGPIIVVWTISKYRNMYSVFAFFILASVVFPIILVFFYDKSLIVALVCSLVFLVVPKGISGTLASYIPLQYRNKINSGTTSAMVNVTASYGAAIMPYLSGLILDLNNGWQINYITVTLCCILAGLMFIPLSIKKNKGSI